MTKNSSNRGSGAVLGKLSLAVVIVWGLLVFPHGAMSYQPPDTGREKCYDDTGEIPCPQPGSPSYGVDAQYREPQPSSRNQGDDGTTSELDTKPAWHQGDDQMSCSMHLDFSKISWEDRCTGR